MNARNATFAAARDWLTARPARERRVLAGGAAALLAALCYLLLAPLPSIPAREARLAALRTDHAALQAELAAAASLRARPEAPALAPGELPAALRRSLVAAGIAGSIDAEGPQRVGIVGQAGFRAWLEWLAAAPRQARLRIVSAEFVAAGNGLAAARIVVEARP